MYGVDQCRICGTAIHVHSRKARDLQEKANLRPPIPEAEWRRRGYLCPPTKGQLTKHAADGCCMECGRKELRKFYGARRRLIVMVSILLSVIFVVVGLVTYMRH